MADPSLPRKEIETSEGRVTETLGRSEMGGMLPGFNIRMQVNSYTTNSVLCACIEWTISAQHSVQNGVIRSISITAMIVTSASWKLSPSKCASRICHTPEH